MIHGCHCVSLSDGLEIKNKMLRWNGHGTEMYINTSGAVVNRGSMFPCAVDSRCESSKEALLEQPWKETEIDAVCVFIGAVAMFCLGFEGRDHANLHSVSNQCTIRSNITSPRSIKTVEGDANRRNIAAGTCIHSRRLDGAAVGAAGAVRLPATGVRLALWAYPFSRMVAFPEFLFVFRYMFLNG